MAVSKTYTFKEFVYIYSITIIICSNILLSWEIRKANLGIFTKQGPYSQKSYANLTKIS